MGATFANVHVHAGDDPEEALERVCDAVENVCAEEGFGPPAAGQNPDRSIVLMRGSEWISVYDEGALYAGPSQRELVHRAADPLAGSPRVDGVEADLVELPHAAEPHRDDSDARAARLRDVQLPTRVGRQQRWVRCTA